MGTAAAEAPLSSRPLLLDPARRTGVVPTELSAAAAAGASFRTFDNKEL